MRGLHARTTMRRLGRTLFVAFAASLAACQVLFGIDEFVPATDPDASTTDGAKPDVVSPPDGGLDGDSSIPVVGEDGGCPTGRGPKMVRVGELCIDATEVTEAQYGAFVVNVSPGDAGQPPECAWNQDFAVGKGPQVEPQFCTKEPGAPVRCVDFCDALAFCKWAGKHLCGAPGGLPGDFGGFADPLKSEWTAACSGNGNLAYPYGNTFSDQTCNGFAGPGKGNPTNAGQLTTCVGSVTGLFDMSGNVHEWEAACIPGDAGGSAGDWCRIRGGSMFDTDAGLLRCAAENQATRSFMAANVGFRCCATATP